MAVVYTDEGKKADLDNMDFSYGKIILFKNNITPGTGTVYNDVAGAGNKADFSGYADANYTPGAITIDGSGNASVTATTATFTHNGGPTANNVYGWALIGVQGATNRVFRAERFSDAPRVMSANGNQISITYTQTQGACP